jgi:hypothetical protein
MPEAPLHRFFTGCPCGGGTLQEAAETGQIFLMLRKEHSEQPVGRNDAHKPAFPVNHGQGGLLLPYGMPGGDFLINARANDGRIAIHQTADEGIRGRSQETLDFQDSHELITLTNDNVACALITLPE